MHKYKSFLFHDQLIYVYIFFLDAWHLYFITFTFSITQSLSDSLTWLNNSLVTLSHGILYTLLLVHWTSEQFLYFYYFWFSLFLIKTCWHGNFRVLLDQLLWKKTLFIAGLPRCKEDSAHTGTWIPRYFLFQQKSLKISKINMNSNISSLYWRSFSFYSIIMFSIQSIQFIEHGWRMIRSFFKSKSVFT